MRNLTRRGFMKAVSLLSFVGAGAASLGTTVAEAAGTPVMVGLLAAHPVGKTKLYNRLSGFSNGYGLVITRTGVNKWVCFDNTCTHEGAPATWVQGNQVICTRHGFAFSALNGNCTNAFSSPLTRYTVTTSKGKIYVSK